MKMSEQEKEEMTDWLIAREECVEEDKKEEKDKSIKEYKEKLIQEITNTKGTISKSKLFSIINSTK